MVVAERSKRIVLCPADNAVMPRCMVHLYYHNADQQPGFMSFALLRDSFYHTLSTSLPLALATDMRMTSQAYGGLTVAAATTDSEYPPVTKHTDKQHTIANMMATNFALDTQPPAITSLPAVTNPLQGNALVTLDVVYLTDGVGLGLSFSHAVADMGAVAKFCQEWSQLAQSLYIDSVPMYMPTKLNTDRAWFWSQILNELP
ncbi:hypothetical protein H4S02_000748 [Coemansia sp. RSA 2611]|nr:hypothetical protein H4S02_000748 [Coemansia sp. RSA 2611]